MSLCEELYKGVLVQDPGLIFKATHSCLELPTIIHFSENHVYSLFTSVIANNLCNILDPDQARQYVGPDLDPNC